MDSYTARISEMEIKAIHYDVAVFDCKTEQDAEIALKFAERVLELIREKVIKNE